MTKNWFFIILYIIFIGMATFMVSLYTEAQKRVDFLKDLQSEVEEDNVKLLAATLVANRGDGTNAIIFKEPLYEQHFIDGEDELKVYIYKVAENLRSYEHSLAILIRDLNITDPTLLKDEDAYSTIRATIKFNQAITIGQTNKQTFEETFITLYDDTSKLLLINFDRLKSESTISFESIHIAYDDINYFSRELVTLYNSDLVDQIPDKFSNTYPRDIEHITSDDIKFLSDESLSDIQENIELYYDANLISQLNKFNNLYLKNISLLLLVVMPLTYFIFFHKEVYTRYKMKRSAKNAQKRQEIEAIKQKKEM